MNMTSKKTESWFLTWNIFGDNGDVNDRRRVKKKRSLATNVAFLLFMFFTIISCCLLSAGWVNDQHSLTATRLIREAVLGSKSESHNLPIKSFPIQCTNVINVTLTCPHNYPTTFESRELPTHTCPDYFKWIHEDLRPWRANGITREMVESAKKLGHFRIITVDGKVYWEKYKYVYQTRDVFTIWGILQLVRLYPGKIPDLDLMFEAGDVPVIKKIDYIENEDKAPPMFHFCGDNGTLDIAFPDWSYWGWPEINIKGWGDLKKDLAQGNKKVPWVNRQPFAFWKGNVHMGGRKKLLQCNSAESRAQIVTQNWEKETKTGFKSSNLADQCIHRFKIYIEGMAWSVSEKYILACDSMALLVTPKWYEFFTRSLEPLKHYWPINPNNLCNSIKFAVDWGNMHTEKAQEIGKSGSNFVQQELSMENVYDYMFHLLNEYAKLLKYKPTVPPGAKEICSETMACLEQGLQKRFRVDSMVNSPSLKNPCILDAPQEPEVIKDFLDKQDSLRRRVDDWVIGGDIRKELPR